MQKFCFQSKHRVSNLKIVLLITSKKFRLNKIGSDISAASLQVIIEREVNGPSSLKGYRNIWNKLRVTYGIKVPRDKVMEILRNIDPVNSALKKARKLSSAIPFD